MHLASGSKGVIILLIVVTEKGEKVGRARTFIASWGTADLLKPGRPDGYHLILVQLRQIHCPVHVTHIMHLKTHPPDLSAMCLGKEGLHGPPKTGRHAVQQVAGVLI